MFEILRSQSLLGNPLLNYVLALSSFIGGLIFIWIIKFIVLKRVKTWAEKTETKISQIEQQIKDLTNSLNSLHKSLISKISEYDANITNVGVEIKAMEKVFQKVLPSLTENVNKLDRIAKSSKINKR